MCHWTQGKNPPRRNPHLTLPHPPEKIPPSKNRPWGKKITQEKISPPLERIPPVKMPIGK
jgi:hypothetical protein